MRTLIIQPWLILSSLVSTIIYLSGALANGAFDIRLWAENWRFGCGFTIIVASIFILVGVITWATGERLNLEDEELNSENHDNTRKD